jgi:hypothetical protein
MIKVTISPANNVRAKVNTNLPVVARNQTPQLRAESINYDISVFVPDFILTPSEMLARIVVARDVTFANNFAGSVGNVKTNPGSDYILLVNKNDATVGSVTVHSNGSFSFSNTSSTDLVSGDTLSVISPWTVDNTISDLSITFLGTRSGI